MISKRRALLAGAAAAMLMLSACSSGNSTDSATAGGPAGDPVTGGTGRIIEQWEPRTLDPAQITNWWANSPVLGNALYGTLMTNDLETGEIDFKLAESLTTADAGKTFTLTLRDGVQFSDGSPFDAAAVKFGWEHVKDPATASPDIPQAKLIESSRVVDDRTLEVTLVEPVPNFANAIVETSMNWIASPASLRAGQQAIDSNPIGAGPYTLEQWSRQDVIKLTRNVKYYDAPLPYLDKLEIRAIGDADQRYNTLVSGGADLALEGIWSNIAKARDAGLQNAVVPLGGGTDLALNTTKAPFDDVRARKAFALALDLDGINNAVFEGTAELPRTLFDESSPFYKDIPLAEQDRAEAQRLLDELAAEGKPLEFTISLYPSNRALGEAIQTQLSTLNNIKVNVRTIDLAQLGQIMARKDYDALVAGLMFSDPEPRLWFGLHSSSSGNYSGIADPQLDEALDKGLSSQDESERVAAYEVVQQRLAELNPLIFYTRAAPGVMANGNVGGVVQYGMGSVLPETLWIQK
ncbi:MULTISPECIES: ABC transporter substrate-binding protein [Rhodococcus]|uniref:ABC transporter substrate-binding protein n=1 Tax=Rhodococcus TaxID=1827 RepID=UPI00211BBECE|nr:ABC transporter substrate-binding protein [Rhodococcus sp. ACS1]